jgi:hypothetical protein
MIKQTDKRLFWTLIPISAFLYNPLTTSGYFMLGMLSWYFPMLGIASIIYLFNRKIINLKIFTSGISLAIFSTFSIVLGVASWIAGITVLLKAVSERRLENQKWIFLWIISFSIIGFCYFLLTYGSGTASETHFEVLFSFTGFSFISNFIASSFRLKYEVLMLLAGIFSIAISIFYFWIFYKKNLLKQYFPWFTLLFVAFCSSIIVTLGRAHMEGHLGNEPYYSTISQFFQIGLIVITGKLILEFNQNPKTLQRKMLVCILFFIISTQMLLLVPSYYSGWERGEHYFNEKMDFVNCFSLSPNPNCLERYSTYEDDFLPMINYLVENNLSIFGESLINNQDEISQKFDNFNHLTEISSINNFEFIGEDKVINMSEYQLDSEVISLNGWFLVDSNSMPESLFLLIDGKPLLENKTFEIEYDYSNNIGTNKIIWSIFFLSGYVEPGCHSLQFVAVSNYEKINLDNDFIICKTS